jgi:hypothetical protein
VSDERERERERFNERNERDECLLVVKHYGRVDEL